MNKAKRETTEETNAENWHKKSTRLGMTGWER